MKITVGGATLNQTPIDWEGNKQNMIYAIEYARMNGVQFLCLPEMCITGYGCEDLFLSDWLYETALQKLFELKEYCYDITVCLGLPLKFNQKNYNCTCLINNCRIEGFYAKQFLANDGIFYEHRWFSPWEKLVTEEITISHKNETFTVPLGDKIFNIGFIDENGGSGTQTVKIGFEICEDAWRTGVRPAIRHKERGVDIIVNPSASNFEFGKTQLRENLVVGSSAEFNCTYIYANLLGNEAGKIIFDGEIILAQQGKLINKNKLLSFQNLNITYAAIDVFNAENTLPLIEKGLFDSKEAEFCGAVALALYDYMRKSRSKGFVLSLSGGADSSCCAVMVAEMLNKGVEELGTEYFLKKGGIENLVNPGETLSLSHLLTCVYQGTGNSSPQTLESAKELALSMGAAFYQWTIDEEVAGYTAKIESVTGKNLSWASNDLALQNIQARTRSPAIWMMANVKNALLLTTSNRSEGDVGYCTMDGDTSGSISPIAGVDKSYIKDWLVWAEKELGYAALQYVNNLEPTAELRPLEKKQKDEDDLMPYSVLNEIEKLAIRQWKSPAEVYRLLKDKNLAEAPDLKSYIIKFFRMWGRNQWKRERLAPSFHLDLHSVDPRSWCRFPILSGGFEEEIEKLERMA